MDELQTIQYLKDSWVYKDAIKETWVKHWILKDHHVLRLELHTMGVTANERRIEYLQKCAFWKKWWSEIKRGGHYYFEIDFTQLGFKPVSQVAKEEGVSRQYIHKIKDKYDWVIISPSKRLIRRK